jgi:hypothetical protein
MVESGIEKEPGRIQGKVCSMIEEAGGKMDYAEVSFHHICSLYHD